MTDYNIWKNGITHSFSPTSLTDSSEGVGFIATAIISSVTTSSRWQMSLWDAYLDLYENLNGGYRPTPKSTTVESSALTGILDGTLILDVTLNRFDVCNSGVFQSSAGIGVMSPSAYGNMLENSSVGSAMDTTTKQWITASSGIFDSSGFITFENNTSGDRIVVGTGGDGDYMIVASCGHTNSGSNETTMTLRINDIDTTIVKEDKNASSVNHRSLISNGILTLNEADYLTMHISDTVTPSNVINVFDCNLTIQRIS